MFLKSDLTWNVVIPPENLDAEGMMLQRAILVQLMDDFAEKKASKDLGYFLAVKTLNHIGEGMIRQDSGDLIFPVAFTCITFKMVVGEILEGTVHKVLPHGVFLRCGPADKVYLSRQKMTGYKYDSGENPFFWSEKSSKIEKGAVLRFLVMAEKYDEAETEFRAIASVDGDDLGPKLNS